MSKLDRDGNFVWAKQWGDTSSDSGWGVAVDGDGNVYAVGNLRDGSGDDDVFLGDSNAQPFFAQIADIKAGPAGSHGRPASDKDIAGGVGGRRAYGGADTNGFFDELEM